MRTMTALISRNRKLFFRDRGMFLSSLITPVILIVLYATFLANVYKDSFLSALPDTVQISDKLINGTVAAQLAAALFVCELYHSDILREPDDGAGSCERCEKRF